MVTPPLVLSCGRRTWAWVEGGVLWISSGGPWAVVADWEPTEGLGGRVLSPYEVARLVQVVGRPK